MNAENVERQRIRRYLLGDVDDSTRESMEEAYMFDDRYFERVEAVGDELIGDHLQGRLSGLDDIRFRRVFLSTDERKQRLRLAWALSQRQAAGPPVHTAASESQLPRATLPWRVWAGIATIVVLTGAIGFVVRETLTTKDLVRRLGTDLARASTATAEPLTSFLLSADLTTRERSSMPPLRIPPGAGTVRLQFRVAPQAGPYDVTIQKDAQVEVWGKGGARPDNAQPDILSIDIPVANLPDGEYRATIAPVSAPAKTLTSDFQIVRR